jgi:putative spermidine/putrescine transport system ATP-binding protein
MISILELSDVAFSYSSRGFKLESISLTVQPGSYMTIVGPNAAGKTTLLKLIGGFLKPSCGRILVGDDDVTEKPPGRRNMCTVFQDGALIPHMTATENVAFGLRARGETDASSRAARLLKTFGIDGLDLTKRPAQLSGGQRQRVAFARALAAKPRILLLDEPLASVDDPSRNEFESLLFSLRNDPATAVLEVTHLQSHALAVSTHVAFLNEGRLLQVAAPEHIYRSPADAACARFFGPNVLEGVIEAGAQPLFRSHGGFATAVPAGCSGGRAKALIRPEFLRFVETPDTSNALTAQIEDMAFRGDHWEYRCLLPAGERLVVKDSSYNLPERRSSEVRLHWRTSDIHVLAV